MKKREQLWTLPLGDGEGWMRDSWTDGEFDVTCLAALTVRGPALHDTRANPTPLHHPPNSHGKLLALKSLLS
jgi:hypothetical protein